MIKVIVFKFFMGVFSVRYGFKKKGIPMVYTCAKDDKEIDIKTYPNRLQVGKEGEVHNNFIWYEWDGSDEQEFVHKLEALKIFKARENMLLHKAEKEIETRKEHERYLEKAQTYVQEVKENGN